MTSRRSSWRTLALSLAATAAASLCAAGSAAAVTITEFTSDVSQPARIAAGSDGNMWYTARQASKIGRISPLGAVTEFSAAIAPNSAPESITRGPDDSMWFVELTPSRIGRISRRHHRVLDRLHGPRGPKGIALGPDGNLWITESRANTIARMTPSGTVYADGVTPDSGPISIAPGPFDTLWFVESQKPGIGRVTVFEGPHVSVGTTTDREQTTATLHGVVNARELTTSAHFEYGTTTGYGLSTPEQTIEGNTAMPARRSSRPTEPIRAPARAAPTSSSACPATTPCAAGRAPTASSANPATTASSAGPAPTR